MRYGRAWATAGAVVVTVVAGVTWISSGRAQTRPGAAPTALRPGVAALVAAPRSRVDWQGAIGGLRQGAIELTPMQEAEYSAEMLAQVNASIPIGRHAAPEEIAALYAFLASDEGAFFTGASPPGISP